MKERKVKGMIKELLFPRRCPVCDGIMGGMGEKICADCLPKLKLVTPPWCRCCGRRLNGEEGICPDCREHGHAFLGGRILYEYESAAGAIYRFKYGGRQEYAEFFGEELKRYLGDFIRAVKPDGIVPIPLHKEREQKRGYNQAYLLARELGRRMELPVYDKLLLRVKNTVPLKQLNLTERQNNLKKAFNIAQNDVKLNTIIIIDDIYTTGSTIDEAAKILLQHGVQQVYFVALSGGGGF